MRKKRDSENKIKGKKKKSFWKYLGMGLWFVIKIPYYIVKGILYLIKKISKKNKEHEIKKKRQSMSSKYEEFKILKVDSGEYKTWEEKVYQSDSQIGIVLGARGSGKTAFGVKFLENYHAKNNKKCFTMGFNENDLPSWVESVSDVSKIENNSFLLIDEGGILFSSRSSMSSANKLLSQLMLIARHKNISILFISQNSSNLEINILRQADFLCLRTSSLLQRDFERKIVQKIYDETKDSFKKFSSDKGLTYIYSEIFRGFVSNSLPSFWKEGLSKGFK